jgi:hypothetical protein
LAFVVSRGDPSGTDVAGPQNILPYVTSFLKANPSGLLYTASSSNSAGDYTLFNNATGNNCPSCGVTVTQNFNPGGIDSGFYNIHNIGVWYTSPNWAVFDQDLQPVQVGAGFNVTVGNSLSISGTVTGDAMLTAAAHPSQNASQILIVTPNWNPGNQEVGVYDDHAVGVWWSGSQWEVYNEDQAAMPAGASFNVRWADPKDGAFVYTTTAADSQHTYATLDNPNLNNQPNAKVFVTHVRNPGGSGSAYHDHPLGVWYTGTRWAILNEDIAKMPVGVSFNVMVAP